MCSRRSASSPQQVRADGLDRLADLDQADANRFVDQPVVEVTPLEVPLDHADRLGDVIQTRPVVPAQRGTASARTSSRSRSLRVGCTDVDLHAQHLLELRTDGEDLEGSSSRSELDEEVDVASGSFVPAGYRAEDGHRPPVMARDDGLDLVAVSLHQLAQRGRPQVGHGRRVRLRNPAEWSESVRSRSATGSQTQLRALEPIWPWFAAAQPQPCGRVLDACWPARRRRPGTATSAPWGDDNPSWAGASCSALGGTRTPNLLIRSSLRALDRGCPPLSVSTA